MQKYKYAGISLILMLSVFLTRCNCHSTGSAKKGADTTTVQNINNPQIKDLTEKIAADSTNPNNYISRANVYMTLKNYRAAYKDLLKATSFDSTKANYFALMGIACMKGNFIAGDIDPFNKALKLDPTNKEIRFSLAQSYFYLRDYQNSLTQLHLLLDQDRKYYQAFFFEGMNFKELGDTAKAISSLQNAVQANPDYYDAYMQLGLLCSDKQNRLAPQYFDDALRIDTNSTEAYYGKAKYYQDVNQDANAKKTYRELIKKDAFNEHAYFNIGFIYLTEDSTMLAYRYFNYATQVKTQYAEAYYYRGLCQELLGNHREALSDIDQAISLKPNFTEAQETYEKLSKEKK
jgi:tetratricopeptide (TPR) repeat protein